MLLNRNADNNITQLIAIQMITTIEDLTSLMARAHKTDAVALDTEFVWERTYFPRLGLIQIALSDEECFIIDPIALKDLTPLGKLLADPAVVKIFHDAPQDLTILRAATKHDPKNIFDSRLAAGFAALGSTLSLAALVERLLDIKLTKSETRTNWLKRPLDPKQTEYALDDVRYLRAIRVLILARVLPETKTWLKEEMLLFNNPQQYLGVTDAERYTKIKGAGSLDCRSLAILKELCTWREEEARQKDKPRGHIIKDSVLITIARKHLTDHSSIFASGEISAKTVKQYGDTIIQLVKNGENCIDSRLPQTLHRKKLKKSEKEALNSLQEYITLKSDVNGIDPALIGNKNELIKIIRHSTETSRQNSGWRETFLAEIEGK